VPVDELAARFARADQYLRDAGVYYRVYGNDEARERGWPLAHVPLLIDEGEWLAITVGLRQRAQLLEALAADIHGGNDIVARGLLPPSLIASSPEFLRPMVGARPRGGHFLHFCAFDLGRAPDGKWWVLGDRTQAPSGAGFALENRVASARAFGDIYGNANVHRVAGFFQAFRDALHGLSEGGTEGRVAVVTPGPLNETYFEHAYIARYLGVLLLEGEDLTVEDGRILVRTISGPQPIDVLWRRVDAAFMDPLELNQHSAIGTPGIAAALRGGAATMVNALGAGILETRALLAFLPRICRALHGEELVLPNIATWWCGQEAERRHVLDNLDRMMIGPALSTRLPIDDEGATVLGSTLSDKPRESMRQRLVSDGADFVGQEAVRLSTTPVFIDGRLEPRPFSLRVYAARTPEGWSFMPGGFARIGSSAETRAIAMQHGGKAADVWVVGAGPVERVSLRPANGGLLARQQPGFLPSRAADNLFWLGRYIERAEEVVRMLRAFHSRLAEAAGRDDPLLERMRGHFEMLGIDADEAIPDGLVTSIGGAAASAGRIRDRFSPDGWLALQDLSKVIRSFRPKIRPGDDCARAMTVLLRKISGFAGLLHENMYRSAGWRFLEIGRRLERGIHMAQLMGRLAGGDAPPGGADMLLEIGDNVMTHRRLYHLNSGPLSVIELMALDQENPRSVVFQLAELRAGIEGLPADPSRRQMSASAREALRLHTEFVIREPAGITPELLGRLARDIAALSDLIARTYLL
jgi:uncharacterized circularly permuted ATP-grasp superfamily protein/uncharacterized alpha-E superfamily protein